MKLETETTWRGGHFHHKDPISRRKMIWLPQIRKFRDREHCAVTGVGELAGTDGYYSASMLKLIQAAIRQCPSISIDANVMEGQPCIDGTRIPVRSVLRAIELYGSLEGATKCYPQLGIQHVKDAIYFSQVILELRHGSDEIAVAS